NDRLHNSANVMKEILNMPDGIPRNFLDKARCVIVLPNVVKGAFVVGASYGRGAMVCRTGPDFSGPWGPPAMYQLEEGSVGFQIGGQATDFVLLVMNDHGMRSLLDSKVKLGGDATVAAGPVGRDAQAATDLQMNAEILTYSRARGVFAGISLDGASLRPDNDANATLYGSGVTAHSIVTGKTPHTPDSAQQLDTTLDQASPHIKSA
ncbi:MAG TPA: lipid-binding SYLF domain-containing protein, partial [Candidatus Acidoferrales bacterium]